MSLKKVLLTASVLAALTLGFVSSGSAQVLADRSVYFTFSQPVTLPQLTLPAGKYLFRLVDALSNRTIVQIYSADGMKPYGMFMTLPASRPDRPEKPEIRFLETAAEMPPAIASYWYPNETTGWEFVYPRDQAQRLAASAKRAVLTTTQTQPATTEQMRTADLVRVTPTGEQQPVGSASAPVAVVGEAQQGEVASDAPAIGAASESSRTAARPTQTASAQSSRTRLPATASPTPLVALAGLLALALALVLRGHRRRMV
jgi:hypothetical protein